MPESAPVWRLIDLDTGTEYIAQYVAQDLTRDQAASFSDAWTMGREKPVIQYVHGERNDIRLRGRLFAEHRNATLENHLRALKQLTSIDEDLGRPHVCRLVVGSAINERVVVVSVGEVKYDELRNDGSPRGVIISCTFRPYDPYDIEFTDPNAPASSTRYYRAAEGETFEHIARYNYFDPGYGDILRRLNPEHAVLEANDLVVAPEPREIRKTRVEPYSIPLTRTEAFVTLRQEMFDLRSKSFFTSVIRGW